jgi:hypothetical protein
MLFDGFYTVVYAAANTHRTLKVETPESGNLAGKTIVGYLVGTDNENDYRFFGFLNPATGALTFWRKFQMAEAPERLARIAAAVRIITSNPTEAGKNYALASGKCCRCGRTLTVPASIHNGLGPECAKKRALGLAA